MDEMQAIKNCCNNQIKSCETEQKILVKIEAHCYAEDELRDEYFDNPPGIADPDIMYFFKDNRGKVYECMYNAQTSVGEFREIVKLAVFSSLPKNVHYPKFTFLNGIDRYEIDDENANFKMLLERYLDINNSGKITVCFLISHNAGIVWNDLPLRFWVNSHEAGKHFLPHVHVRDISRSDEASIQIITGEVLRGKLTKKREKQAKEIILSNQEYFLRCWNIQTDGLKVDINHALGLIKY